MNRAFQKTEIEAGQFVELRKGVARGTYIVERRKIIRGGNVIPLFQETTFDRIREDGSIAIKTKSTVVPRIAFEIFEELAREMYDEIE